MTYNQSMHRWEDYNSLFDPKSRWRAKFDWCWQTFGHPGTDPETGVKSSWSYHGGWIYFYDEKYVSMYQLAWS